MTKPTACLRVTWRRSRESSRQSIGLKNDHWDCCRRSKSCHRQRWTVALALLCRHEVFQTDDNRQCGRNGTAHMVNFERAFAGSSEYCAESEWSDRSSQTRPRYERDSVSNLVFK